MIDPEKSYKTVFGLPVDNLRLGGPELYPLQGEIQGRTFYWTKDGHYTDSYNCHNNDLVLTEKHA